MRFQYVLFFLLVGMFCWALYLRIVFDVWVGENVNEPESFKRILYSLVERLALGEGNLKVAAILAPAAAAYFYRYYRDGVNGSIKYMVTGAIALLFMLWPAENFGQLPSVIGLVLGFSSICVYINCLMALSVLWYSKKMKQDQFNEKNQGFPQERKKKEGKYIFSLGYEFFLEGKRKKGHINFVNVFRSIWIWGKMGAGKTFNFLVPMIHRMMGMQFAMLVYDLKFPSLSKRTLDFYRHLAPKGVGFYQICITDMRYSHRCNPIAPQEIPTISDIDNACNTVFRNLKTPDESESAFFKGTALGLFVALVAISKEMQSKYELEVCSLPHVAILASVKIKYLLPILLSQRELITKVSSLRDAFDGGAAEEQLAGSTASLQQKLSRLFNLDAYYIFSGTGDFSVDLNELGKPKILVIGGDKDKTEVIAPYLSLMVEMVGKKTNMPGKHPFVMVLDELSSFYYGGLVDFLETGRENLNALIAGVQGMDQLEKRYARAEANTIVEVQGSVICGMAGVRTATELSRRIGKTNQKRPSITQGEGTPSMTHGFFREDLVTVDRITNFSQGEFCGVLADSFENPILQKRFLGNVKKDFSHDIPSGDGMPEINGFSSKETESVFKHHWDNMIKCGFFRDYMAALEKGDFIFVPGHVRFYIDYMALDNAKLETEIKKVKKLERRGSFDLQKYCTDYFSRELDRTILENEKHHFLKRHLEKLYGDVEDWVKREYKSITGKEVSDDLFQIGNNEDRHAEEIPF